MRPRPLWPYNERSFSDRSSYFRKDPPKLIFQAFHRRTSLYSLTSFLQLHTKSLDLLAPDQWLSEGFVIPSERRWDINLDNFVFFSTKFTLIVIKFTSIVRMSSYIIEECLPWKKPLVRDRIPKQVHEYGEFWWRHFLLQGILRKGILGYFAQAAICHFSASELLAANSAPDKQKVEASNFSNWHDTFCCFVGRFHSRTRAKKCLELGSSI